MFSDFDFSADYAVSPTSALDQGPLNHTSSLALAISLASLPQSERVQTNGIRCIGSLLKYSPRAAASPDHGSDVSHSPIGRAVEALCAGLLAINPKVIFSLLLFPSPPCRQHLSQFFSADAATLYDRFAGILQPPSDLTFRLHRRSSMASTRIALDTTGSSSNLSCERWSSRTTTSAGSKPSSRCRPRECRASEGERASERSWTYVGVWERRSASKSRTRGGGMNSRTCSRSKKRFVGRSTSLAIADHLITFLAGVLHRSSVRFAVNLVSFVVEIIILAREFRVESLD